MLKPLQDLKSLIKTKLAHSQSLVGTNNAAMKMVARIVRERAEETKFDEEIDPEMIWGNLGIGSDVAAALVRKKRKRD